jgi:hypothetical protein
MRTASSAQAASVQTITLTLEADAPGSAIIKFTDVQFAAIGEGVTRPNGQHTAARLTANNSDLRCALQSRDEYFRSARGSFAGHNNERYLGFARAIKGGCEHGIGFQRQGYLTLTISKLAQHGGGWQEGRGNSCHGGSIATAIAARACSPATKRTRSHCYC